MSEAEYILPPLPPRRLSRLNFGLRSEVDLTRGSASRGSRPDAAVQYDGDILALLPKPTALDRAPGGRRNVRQRRGLRQSEVAANG